MFEKSIGALYSEYEKRLDMIDLKESELATLDTAYEKAKKEYHVARSSLVSRIEGMGLEADELKEAMEILGDCLE